MTKPEAGFNNKPPALILIVDDLSENLAVLGNILRTEGYQIAIANSGMQAVSIAESRHPDLILLDVAMPQMDGKEACRRIKQNPLSAGIPVIFLTARSDTDDVVQGFEAGAVDYITKPFRSAELLARVSNHLELQRTRNLISTQNEELSKLLDTKNKLFSIIAHDLRSPFSGLLALSDIMIETFDETPKNELLDSMVLIRDTAFSLHVLSENLLSWARLQLSEIMYSPELLNLEEHIEKSLKVLALNLAKKKIRTNIENFTDLKAYADPEMLRIVFHNLIGNAIKFSNQDAAISVHAGKSDQFVTITISDEGVGIPEERLNDLFKTGRNISTSGTANETGSGLGLMLCHEMVEKMGGTIGAISNPGNGTSFWFTLPST